MSHSRTHPRIIGKPVINRFWKSKNMEFENFEKISTKPPIYFCFMKLSTIEKFQAYFLRNHSPFDSFFYTLIVLHFMVFTTNCPRNLWGFKVSVFFLKKSFFFDIWVWICAGIFIILLNLRVKHSGRLRAPLLSSLLSWPQTIEHFLEEN